MPKLNMPVNIDPKLAYAIEALYASRERARLWFKYDGKVVDEEHDVMGIIGRTPGSHSPLLLYNSHSYGGGLLNLESVACVMRSSDKVVLYQQAGFEMPSYVVVGTNVYRDGSPVACFRDADKSQRWADFMMGKRMRV